MAVTMNFYDRHVLNFGSGKVNLSTDAFTIMLMQPAHVFDADNDVKADIAANELPTGNGYTQGAKALTSVTWTQTAGVAKFDAAPVTWTAAGGSIGPADYASVYSETSAADNLLFDIDFGGSQTAGDGTDFKITWNAGGIFTVQ